MFACVGALCDVGTDLMIKMREWRCEFLVLSVSFALFLERWVVNVCFVSVALSILKLTSAPRSATQVSQKLSHFRRALENQNAVAPLAGFKPLAANVKTAAPDGRNKRNFC